MKMLTATLVILLVVAAAVVSFAAPPAPAAGGGAKLEGDFTVAWRQRINDPVATTQPSLHVGDFKVEVRPTPKAKPKDVQAFHLALGDTVRSKTQLYPGKWYCFALSSTGGRVQLYVNGSPDGPPQAVTPAPAGFLGVGRAGASAAPVADAELLKSKPASAGEIRELVRQRLQPGREITTVAHRGNNRFAPENTRISYVEAVAAGAPVLEFDTALSADGHVIGMHDKTVDRTTGGKGKVAEMTLQQLRQLEAGAWKDPKYKGEPVPTLDEVAAVARSGNAVLMLDLKAEGQGPAIAKWLETSKYPHDQLMLAPWEDAEGVALRQHVPATVPMIRLTSKVPTETVNDAYFEKMKSIGFSGFSVNWQHLTDEFTQSAQKNGMKVFVWTVNDDPDLAGAAMLGVDGIVTDDPAHTIQFLAELKK